MEEVIIIEQRGFSILILRKGKMDQELVFHQRLQVSVVVSFMTSGLKKDEHLPCFTSKDLLYTRKEQVCFLL